MWRLMIAIGLVIVAVLILLAVVARSAESATFSAVIGFSARAKV